MVRIFALIMRDDEYGRRIIENICYRRFSHWIWGIHEFSQVPSLETLLDDIPSTYLPRSIPKCDLVLSLGLPQELQMLIPSIAKRSRAKAVIVAVDDPRWVPPGLRRQISDELEDLGIAYAFPKPLCELMKTGNKYIDEFAEYFGKAKLEIEVKGGVIRHVKVIRGAPCGSTWYIAEKLIGSVIEPRETLWERIAKAHHTYPCLASMEMDQELGDTILHKAQYLIRGAVEDSLR